MLPTKEATVSLKWS